LPVTPATTRATHLDPALCDPASIERVLEDVLPRVQKPARYTGGEFNSIAKDWRERRADGQTRVSLALTSTWRR